MPLGKQKSLYDSLTERYGSQKVREMNDKINEKKFKKAVAKDLEQKGSSDIEAIGTLFYDKETKKHTLELNHDVLVTLMKPTDDPEFKAFWLDIEKDVVITLRRK